MSTKGNSKISGNYESSITLPAIYNPIIVIK